MSFCLFPKWFCRVPVLISQRGSINWLSSICLSSIWLWIHRCWNMECKTPGRTWNPYSVIFRGKWHTQMICGVSGQNSSHLTSNVTLWTSTPDPVIWTAFVINREKLLWAQLIYFKCTYVTFSFNLLLWHQLCSSCLYLGSWDTQWRWGTVLHSWEDLIKILWDTKILDNWPAEQTVVM